MKLPTLVHWAWQADDYCYHLPLYVRLCTYGLLLFCIYGLRYYYFVALFALHCYNETGIIIRFCMFKLCIKSGSQLVPEMLLEVRFFRNSS